MTTSAPLPPDPSQDKPLPHLGNEYGTGKENLPPAKIVGIVLAVIFVVVGIYAFIYRPKSLATGSIDDVVAVDIADQNSVMVAINVTVNNNSKYTFKMREISVETETADGTHTDEPATAVDFARYVQAFPPLQQHALDPLKLETIPIGGQSKGRVIVSFPVSADAFANRKSLKVTISAFGEPVPLVLTK
jgi:hypothetical protein